MKEYKSLKEASLRLNYLMECVSDIEFAKMSGSYHNLPYGYLDYDRIKSLLKPANKPANSDTLDEVKDLINTIEYMYNSNTINF
jgi:hypothetical protein